MEPLLDREDSANNLWGPAAFTKEKAHHQSRRDSGRRDQTYTKRHRDKLLQGSLENVSSNPLGELGPHESSLRRSRSLAISREDVFTNLEIPNAQRNRRSQLIPRAKLIDRYSTKDRCLQRGFSQESLYISDRSLLRRKTSVGGDYGAAPQQSTNRHHLNNNINRQDERESPYIHTNNFSQPAGEIDSLDSNYHNKTSLNTTYRVSTENLAYPDAGLSLPNYYPDSKCDTDLSFTDNVSLTDPNNELNVSNSRNNSENISYDENIVFAKHTLYDKVKENNYYNKSKPRTIRGSTPYHQEESYYNGKPRSLPNYTIAYDSDSSLSDYDPKYYEPSENNEPGANFEATKSSNDDNTNISGAINSDNEKENDVYGSKSDFSNIETNPIYDEIPLVTDISAVQQEELISKSPIKTSIQVQAEQDLNCEEYKTVVSVPEQQKSSESEDGSPKEAKKHSHNYLKEFLETQKGSKKPLQNFLSKRISRAFHGDKKPEKKCSNLIENQYFSLPDITVSKSLQKCEKIDRKLRKCDSKLEKSPSDATNRFIVNIGNHFDVTAHSSIPVDFELKISKIPKSKVKKQKSNASDRERSFMSAVKNLKETLTFSQSSDDDNEVKTEKKTKINKIIVNGEEINTDDFYQRDKEVEVIIEDTNNKMNEDEVSKEFQEKISTMRNYWGSICSDNKEKSDPIKEDAERKCKIVGMQTKVDEVKKKFEPPEVKPPPPPSIVQMTKQFFEKKPAKTPNKALLENPFFEKEQYESLNPSAVEIVERVNKPAHKPVAKSRSITEEPQFDHVRYRVMKSDLFQKKIFANCEKESQFDGLMQYLQDYSFQELLIDNNIVIIEPIRTNVQYIGSNKSKQTRNVTQYIHKPELIESENSNLKRHFFYHPIRVNREVNDDELPNPDTVKQVRQMFEGELPRSQSSKHLETLTKQTVQYRPIDPDKDRCSASDSNSSNFGSNENVALDNEICCEQFVSEDILEKIRECGTSITYYGGRVLDKRTGKSSAMTKAIMDEIQNQKRRGECKCRRNSSVPKNVTFADNKNDNDTYQGIKFKLLKSNSCSSRLELVGTKNLAEYRNKFINKQKQLIQEHNARNQKQYTETATINLKATKSIQNTNTKNKINETPKIIAEEMKTAKKLIQWGEMKDSTYAGINFTKGAQKTPLEYHNFDKVKPKSKKLDEMEFEPYEIAGN